MQAMQYIHCFKAALRKVSDTQAAQMVVRQNYAKVGWEDIFTGVSHPEDGHGDQAQHVGEHELLVDAEMEPGIVWQEVLGAHLPVRG